MDMQKAVEEHESRLAIAELAKEYDTIFIAPLGDAVPEDGVLAYQVVVDVKDVINATENAAVLLFGRESLTVAEMLVKYSVLFKLHPVVLAGIPGSEYGAEWDAITWMLDKASYSTLLSELALSERVDEERRLSSRSDHDVERDKITRADGTVKEYTSFDLNHPDEED